MINHMPTLLHKDRLLNNNYDFINLAIFIKIIQKILIKLDILRKNCYINIFSINTNIIKSYFPKHVKSIPIILTTPIIITILFIALSIYVKPINI